MNVDKDQGKKLGHYHTSIAKLLAGTSINTNFDLGGAFKMAQLAAAAVTKPEHRQEVVDALVLMKTTVGKATHLKKVARQSVENEIDDAITAIGTHPAELPRALNGNAEELPPGGFMADKSTHAAGQQQEQHQQQ
jgi:hypothetical protein